MEGLREELHEVKLEIVGARKDIASLMAAVQTNNQDLDEHRRWRDGDGEQPGVKVRLDRIERFCGNMVAVAGILATAIAGSVAYAYFGH